MYISAETLDDLLVKVYRRLLRLRGTSEINPTKGAATELNGVLLQIRNPRARLSRTEQKSTFFSCLGEFLWYLSGSDRLDFIEYYIPRYEKYSDDKVTIFGAYGPRLFNMRGINQVQNVVELLRRRADSRRAVIQLFRAEDLDSDLATRREDIPCTCTLQLTIRTHRLHMFATMRSNDAYLGLPHDVFAFTMLQEIIARSLNVEVGGYKHAIGSLHLYSSNTEEAQRYIDEGLQARIAMPSMPPGDPWPALKALIRAEQAIRSGRRPSMAKLDPYWADLVRLLRIYRYSRGNRLSNLKAIVSLKNEMQSEVYETYIQKRERQLAPAVQPVEDLLFDPAELDAGMESLSSESDG